MRHIYAIFVIAWLFVASPPCARVQAEPYTSSASSLVTEAFAVLNGDAVGGSIAASDAKNNEKNSNFISPAAPTSRRRFLNAVSAVSTKTLISRYQLVASVIDARIATQACAYGYASIVIAYAVSFIGVLEWNQVVGPRTVADLYTSCSACVPLFASQYADAFINGSFVSPVCAAHTCTFRVSTASECRLVTADGNAFNQGPIANDTASIGGTSYAGVGAYASTRYVYPPTTWGRHDWYVDVYSTIGSAAATRISVSPAQPDRVAVFLELSAYPTSVASFAFDVLVGLLASPLDAIERAVALIDARGATTQTPFTWNARANPLVSLTLVVHLVGTLVATTDLLLGTAPGDITLTPLDAAGVAIMRVGASSPIVLDYAHLAPLMQYTPKLHSSLNSSSNSSSSSSSSSSAAASAHMRSLPAASNARGVDGFSIPMALLQQVVNVPFDAIALHITTYTSTINIHAGSTSASSSTAAASSTATSSPRRLLDTDANSDSRIKRNVDATPTHAHRARTHTFVIRMGAGVQSSVDTNAPGSTGAAVAVSVRDADANTSTNTNTNTNTNTSAITGARGNASVGTNATANATAGAASTRFRVGESRHRWPDRIYWAELGLFIAIVFVTLVLSIMSEPRVNVDDTTRNHNQNHDVRA